MESGLPSFPRAELPGVFVAMPGSDKHAWEVSAEEAVRIQRELSRRVVVEGALDGLRLVGGADVAVCRETRQVSAAAVVLDWASLQVVGKAVAVAPVRFPYVSGLLSFREGPVLLEALEMLRPFPDAVIFDGQGVAHPRRLGIAAHLGVLLDVPTIGCAKSRLVGTYAEPGGRKGDCADLMDGGHRVGTVLRTRDNVRPVFVSPGHRVSFQRAAQVVLACCRGYRLPEPARQAHIEAGKLRRTLVEGPDPASWCGAR